MTALPVGYGATLDAALDDTTRHGIRVATAVRNYWADDAALNDPIWAELGLSLRERAAAMFELLPHVDTEQAIDFCFTPESLAEIVGGQYDVADFDRARGQALAEARAETVAKSIAWVREVTT